MSEDEKKKSFVIFGQDVGKMPCFRESYLYGSGSGLGAGLLYFMFTSRVQHATHAAVGTFMAVSTGYWFYCRHRYFRSKFQHDQMKHLMKSDSMMDKIDFEDVDLKEKPKSA